MLNVEPFDPDAVHPYTRCRVMVMNGIEVEAQMLSDQFTRHTNDKDTAPVKGDNSWVYGLGVFLLGVGLILALAITDSFESIDLTMTGWILAAAGLLGLALSAFQASRFAPLPTDLDRPYVADGPRSFRLSLYSGKTTRSGCSGSGPTDGQLSAVSPPMLTVADHLNSSPRLRSIASG